LKKINSRTRSDFFLPFSKTKTPEMIKLKSWKSGSGKIRHFFYIGHHRVQTLTSLRVYGTSWRRLYTAVWFTLHQHKISVKMETNVDLRIQCNSVVIGAKDCPTSNYILQHIYCLSTVVYAFLLALEIWLRAELKCSTSNRESPNAKLFLRSCLVTRDLNNAYLPSNLMGCFLF